MTQISHGTLDPRISAILIDYFDVGPQPATGLDANTVDSVVDNLRSKKSDCSDVFDCIEGAFIR